MGAGKARAEEGADEADEADEAASLKLMNFVRSKTKIKRSIH